MGRSRSNSRSRSRSGDRRSRSRSRRRNSGRHRSNSGDEEMGTRLHVSDIPVSVDNIELEKTFEKFGPLIEVWKTNSVPCFAFVVFVNKDDAEDAIRSLNGQHVFGNRVRVTLALPRARERQRRSGGMFNSDARCYQCGQAGHFSRSCHQYEGAGRNRMAASPPRRRYSPPQHRRQRRSSDSRSRSRSRDRRQQYSRDRRSSGGRRQSPDRRRNSHRGDEPRRAFKENSRSRSKSGDRNYYDQDVINAQNFD